MYPEACSITHADLDREAAVGSLHLDIPCRLIVLSSIVSPVARCHILGRQDVQRASSL